MIISIITISPVTFFVISFFKTTYRIFYRIIKIATVLTICLFIISLIIIYIQYIADTSHPIFYIYCPFNFELNDIKKIFDFFLNDISIYYEDQKKQLNEECNNRRCISYINQNEEEKYLYICNFNSIENIDDNDDNLISCQKFYSNNSLESKTMTQYINLCESVVDFYLCELFEEPHKYSLSSNYICPTKEKKNITFEIVVSVSNIIFPIVVYILQYYLYKNIIKIIVTNNVRRALNSNNENKTNDTSKKSVEKKESDKSKSFKKEPTDLIIIDNDKNEEQIIQIYNKNNKNKNATNHNINLFKNNKIKNEKKNIKKKIEKIKFNIENNNNEKNRSFTNSNSNNFFNEKINKIDSLRNLTLNDNEDKDKNVYYNKTKVYHNESDNDVKQIKYIKIKK
jgi:hypothetical protein